MNTVELENRPLDTNALVEGVYAGSIYTLGRSTASIHLNGAARAILAGLFPDVEDLQTAQFVYEPNEFRDRLLKAQVSFSQHFKVRELVESIIAENGIDLENVRYEIPNLRAVPHDGQAFETSFAVHRDTWYGQPQCQVNWWMSIYDLPPEQSFGFFPTTLPPPSKTRPNA